MFLAAVVAQSRLCDSFAHLEEKAVVGVCTVCLGSWLLFFLSMLPNN